MSTPWEVRFSNSRQLPYFYNPQTSTSTWTPPPELTQAQVQSLPGAAQYWNNSGAPPNQAGVGVRADQQKGQDGQVRASHILAKHVGSRRASSWRQDKITRPLPEAREIIQNHINHLKSLPADKVPEAFAKIASTESDCSSAKKGGDLGFFGKGMMQKSFEDATFALAPGQLSDIIESDSGVHVIYRTA